MDEDAGEEIGEARPAGDIAARPAARPGPRRGREQGIDYGPLPSYIGYRIRQAQTAAFRDLGGAVRDIGLTPGEFSLLTMVAANPGITQARLVEAHRLKKSTLSLAVKALVERGLVRRRRDRDDRRFFAIELTGLGRAKLARFTRRIEAQEREMDSVLAPGEREQLIDLLSRIARKMNK